MSSRDVKFNELKVGKLIVDSDAQTDGSTPEAQEQRDDQESNYTTTDEFKEPVATSKREKSGRSKRETRKPFSQTDEYDYSDAMIALMVKFVVNDAPADFKDIEGRSDAADWRAAVKDENKSFELTKWVFKRKIDENGKLAQFKARLVALGYMQKKGTDYGKTYAPVARMSTIRLLLAIGIQKQFQFRHLDVKTAFLNGL